MQIYEIDILNFFEYLKSGRLFLHDSIDKKFLQSIKKNDCKNLNFVNRFIFGFKSLKMNFFSLNYLVRK